MPPTASPLVISARPTIRLDGVDDDRLSSLLTRLEMVEREGGLSSLEVRISQSASLASGLAEYAFDAGGAVDLGRELVVGAGDAQSPVEIFRGRITGVEGLYHHDAPPELILLAEDALQRLRCRRRSQTFENRSLGDIVRQLANDHGLTVVFDASDADFGPEVQLNETDLGFLRRLLERIDADIQIVGTELHVAARPQIRRGEIELELGRELRSARVLADLAHQVTRTTVRGWDVGAGAALEAEGEDRAPGSADGRPGRDAFRDTFGERHQHEHARLGATQAEVDALAASAQRARDRRFVRVEAVATGQPQLRVGTQVTLRGVGTWFSHRYQVTGVRHRFDLIHGYETEFEAQGAFLGTR